MTSAILSVVTDEPRATEDEQEQGPERIEEEEAMREASGADPELPADESTDEDDA